MLARVHFLPACRAWSPRTENEKTSASASLVGKRPCARVPPLRSSLREGPNNEPPQIITRSSTRSHATLFQALTTLPFPPLLHLCLPLPLPTPRHAPPPHVCPPLTLCPLSSPRASLSFPLASSVPSARPSAPARACPVLALLPLPRTMARGCSVCPFVLVLLVPLRRRLPMLFASRTCPRLLVSRPPLS